MNLSPPGSSVHGIFQARVLEWVAMPSSRRSSQPRDRTQVSCVFCIAGRFFTTWANREVHPVSLVPSKSHSSPGFLCLSWCGYIPPPPAVLQKTVYKDPEKSWLVCLIQLPQQNPPAEQLNTTEITSLTLLGTRSTKSRCQHGWFLLEAPSKQLPHVLLLTSSSDYWQFLAFRGLSKHSSNLYFSIYVALLYVCLWVALLLLRYWSLDLGPALKSNTISSPDPAKTLFPIEATQSEVDMNSRENIIQSTKMFFNSVV